MSQRRGGLPTRFHSLLEQPPTRVSEVVEVAHAAE